MTNFHIFPKNILRHSYITHPKTTPPWRFRTTSSLRDSEGVGLLVPGVRATRHSSSLRSASCRFALHPRLSTISGLRPSVTVYQCPRWILPRPSAAVSKLNTAPNFTPGYAQYRASGSPQQGSHAHPELPGWETSRGATMSCLTGGEVRRDTTRSEAERSVAKHEPPEKNPPLPLSRGATTSCGMAVGGYSPMAGISGLRPSAAVVIWGNKKKASVCFPGGMSD